MAETPLQKGTGASEVKTSQPHWPQPFYTKGLGQLSEVKTKITGGAVKRIPLFYIKYLNMPYRQGFSKLTEPFSSF